MRSPPVRTGFFRCCRCWFCRGSYQRGNGYDPKLFATRAPIVSRLSTKEHPPALCSSASDKKTPRSCLLEIGGSQFARVVKGEDSRSSGGNSAWV